MVEKSLSPAQLWEHGQEWGDRLFLIHRNQGYTYSELEDEVRQKREQLSKIPLASGSVVALCGDYSFANIALFLALVKNQNIVVPLAVEAETEVEKRLKEAMVDWRLRIEDGSLKATPHPSPLDKHSLIKKLQETHRAGLILFSSGTTGNPKAMLHDLSTLLQAYGHKKGKTLRILAFLLFDHIGGLDTLFRALANGATLVVPENREVGAVCALIARHRIDVLPASPTFLNLLLIAEAYRYHDLSSLKIIGYGAEPMPGEVLKKLNVIFPQVQFQQKFGTSETNAIRVRSHASDSTLMKIDDPKIEYKIVEGELWLRSQTQILGYLNDAMANFTREGWFCTGDLVEQTGDGFFKIVGRRQEVINVGGQKVLPSEIEALLLQMPEINDCLVYGEKNIITGQSVTAEVVPSIPMENLKAKKKIRAFCQNRLESYKIPTKVKVIDKTAFNVRFKKIRIQ